MASYENTRQLKEDVLFRASEELNGSGYETKVIDYLNRVQRTLCAGASEFLPEYVEDWWWLRSKGTLTLLPAITLGTVLVTQNSAAITFSSAPIIDVTGWRLKIGDWGEQFEIASHTASSASATLDSPYTGGSSVAASFTLMKVTYSLDTTVASIISPMIGFRDNPKIIGLSPERMDELYPLPYLTTGIPAAFALENNQVVRFSGGGRTDDKSMRIEYRYRPLIVDLYDDPASIPTVPLEWRHLLADMALTYVLLDKNDDRSNAVALAARTGLAGMLKENRRRIPKMDTYAGHIFPRSAPPPDGNRGPLRTESGLIIGWQ